MKTHISETPDKEAGEFISAMLEEHAHDNMLLLLSGGSAFAILPYIDTSNITSKVTIGMADERFTRDEQGNNFLTLQKTPFYEKAYKAGAQFFESVPKESERQEDFANRIKEEIEAHFYAHPNSYALGIFGIGEDGHTAGIFPTSEKDFASLYKTSEFYIALTQESHAYPFRTTVTPTLIEEVLDDVVLYAVGTNKCENILDYMYNRTFEQHEVPALIPASHPQSILFTDCPTLTP